MAKKRSRARSTSPVPPTTPAGNRGDPGAAKKKKKRASTGRGAPKDPRTLADADSLERIPSVLGGTVRTSAVDPSEGDLLLDRMRKEVCERFGVSLSAGAVKATEAAGGPGEKASPPSSSVVVAARSRLLVGTNACTRLLESAVRCSGSESGEIAPTLAVLARDVRPPTTLAHLPVLCRDVGTPVLLLPGKASVELGRAVGVRSAAVMMFLPRPPPTKGGDGDEESESKEVRNCHKGIDSFVAYARGKILA